MFRPENALKVVMPLTEAEEEDTVVVDSAEDVEDTAVEVTGPAT